MANLATRIDYKVYIAGVLVPASAVTVSTQLPGFSSAQISLPAHPLIFGLGEGDRLQVAIFYLDTGNPSGELHWNLLFEGFLISTQYSSSSISREVQVSAVSNYDIFNKLYLEFLGGKGKGKLGKPDKNFPDEITLKGNYPRRLFTEGLNNKTYIKRPFDFIGNIFLAASGRFLDRDVSKKSSKSLDVYITKQLDLVSQRRDNALNRLSNDDAKAKEYLLAELNKIKNSLDTGTERVTAEEEIKSALAKFGLIARVNQTDKKILRELLSRFDKKYLENTFKKTVGKRNLATRSVVNTGFFARYFNLTKLEQHFVASPIVEGIPGLDKSVLPSGIAPVLRTSRGKKYVRALARMTGRKYGASGTSAALINNVFQVLNYEILDILAPGIVQVDDIGIPTKAFDPKKRSNRIVQHVTKPTTPYGIPPSCNTLFPCMVTSWSISKNYASAPTRYYYDRKSQGRRLSLKSNKKGYADHGTYVGYPAKITRHAQNASSSRGSDLEVLVFPEEYYRGPNPVFTEINPLLYEIKRLENSRRVEGVTKIPKDSIQNLSDGSIPADQLNFLQEALLKASSKGNDSYGLFVKQAQVDYVTARTAGTQVSINTIFNPNMVPGFSSLMFDSEDSNIPIIGYVRNITHTLSQGASSTSVGLTNVRTLKDMLVGIMNQGANYIMHPIEPLTENREVFQVPEVANLYYKYLLYLGTYDSDVPGIVERSTQDDLVLKIKEIEVSIKQVNQELDDKENEEDSNGYKLEEEIQKLNKKKSALEKDLDSANSKLADEVQNPTQGEERKSFALNWPTFFNLVSYVGPGETNEEPLQDFIGQSKLLTRSNNLQENYNKVLKGFLKPKEELRPFMENLAVALRYVRRPICTLEQYIDFYKTAPDFINPTSEVTGGRGRGTRAKKNYLDGAVGVAPYYSIIREFVGGPGIEPGVTISDLSNQQSDTSVVPQLNYELTYKSQEPDSNGITSKLFTSLKKGETASIQDLPDLSLDYQEVLLMYSDIIRTGGKL